MLLLKVKIRLFYAVNYYFSLAQMLVSFAMEDVGDGFPKEIKEMAIAHFICSLRATKQGTELGDKVDIGKEIPAFPRRVVARLVAVWTDW